MASLFQSVGASVGWRKHQLLADFENESPLPDKFRKRCSSSSLDTFRMSLRKRMPLKQVELNIGKDPTWESLEAKEKRQTLQAITRTAKNAFGTLSQKIQKSCRSTTQSLVTPPAKACARSGVASSAKKRSTPTRTPRRRNRLATITTPLSTPRCTPRSSKRAPLSSGSAKNLGGERKEEFLSLAWRGGCSSPKIKESGGAEEPIFITYACQQKEASCSDLEFDCELESVSLGIRRLKRLSQVFDDVIVREEREQAVSSYHHLMLRNLQSVHPSQKLSHLFLRRHVRRLQRMAGTWTEMTFNSINNK